MDLQSKAVKNGWLPFYPQFDRSPIQVVREAEEAGAVTDEEVVQHTVSRLKDKSLRFSIDTSTWKGSSFSIFRTSTLPNAFIATFWSATFRISTCSSSSRTM